MCAPHALIKFLRVSRDTHENQAAPGRGPNRRRRRPSTQKCSSIHQNQNEEKLAIFESLATTKFRSILPSERLRNVVVHHAQETSQIMIHEESPSPPPLSQSSRRSDASSSCLVAQPTAVTKRTAATEKESFKKSSPSPHLQSRSGNVEGATKREMHDVVVCHTLHPPRGRLAETSTTHTEGDRHFDSEHMVS